MKNNGNKGNKKFIHWRNNEKIESNKEELFNLRFSQATGNLEKPSRIRELRKEVARMKTIIRERELNK